MSRRSKIKRRRIEPRGVSSKKKSTESQIDLTLPGRKPFVGRKHPLTQTLDEMKSIFYGMGFSVEDGPELETDYYCFEALNIPKNHPARDMQDTLYITDDIVLDLKNIENRTGFDVHAYAEGRKLILGGVEIDYEKGLEGHSDADVLVHAVMDSVLGA